MRLFTVFTRYSHLGSIGLGIKHHNDLGVDLKWKISSIVIGLKTVCYRKKGAIF